MKKLRLYTCLFVLFAFAQAVSAQAYLSVQGTIQKSTGAAVDDGDYTLIFKLYTTETGGTPVWSETQDPVNIIGGVYSVTLGSTNPLTAAFDRPYYLGVSVGSGAELTPRTRLTSSPYALSLIGQDNIFPSTGAVGAGTAAPAAGYKLHVKAETGDGKLLVEGADNAKIDLKKGANTASVTYNGSAISVPGTVNLPGTVNVGTLTATNFSYNPANMAITSKLAVGQASVDNNFQFKVQGESQFNGWVNVDGGRSWNPGGHWVHGGAGNLYPASGEFSFAMQVNGRIRTAEVWCNSDRRIKKDFHLSEGVADLTTLRKLRVTDYRHIAEDNGSLKKGFIAQEVKETFPEAVTIAPDFIPSVDAVSERTQLANGQLTISLNKDHGFVSGDEVKLETRSGVKKLKVLATPAPNAFSVEWTDAAEDKIYVYGKKVSDFHTVDYDRIFTLNVSATQELARRVEQLEAENAALRRQNQGLQQQNEGLRSDVSDIFKRLLELEKQSAAGGHSKK